MKETFEYMKKEKQLRRRRNMKKRLAFIEQSDLNYKILDKQGGHVRVFMESKNLDIWVSSGKYTVVGSNKYKSGWNSILKEIGLGNEYFLWCKNR